MSDTISFSIGFAVPSDAAEISAVEKASFGITIHPEELRMILEKGLGEVIIARDSITQKIIGYQAILFKSPKESVLQPLLRESTIKYMHDDIHKIDEGNEAYLHLLGVLPQYQGKGVGKALIKYAFDNLSKRFKKITSIVRINNIASMYPVMKVTQGSLVSFQQKSSDPKFAGSSETNINILRNTGSNVNDIRKVSTNTFIWEDGHELSDQSDILVPVKHGEEDELKLGSGKILVEKVKQLFLAGYVGIDIVKLDEFSMSSGRFFYLFTKGSKN